MAPKNQMGFKSDQKAKGKTKGPADTSVIYSQTFSNLIPGDVAVSVEKAMGLLGHEYEEISTLKAGGMGGEPVEVPFVRTQLEDGTDIPYGTFRVKGIGDIGMNLTQSGRIPCMQLTAILNGKECKDKWNELVSKIKELSVKNSIFKNRAVRVGSPQDLLVPVAMDLSADQKVFFNEDIEELLNTCVLWPIKHRAEAASLGIRTKRGTLLDGFYGCGKSLFLYNAAKLANSAGWTVLSMDPGMITAGVALAPMLEPVCLIVEDVDAGAHGNRDYLNALLNSLSSVSAKCSKDMILLVSTNFLSRIDPALLRPERIDAVIKVPLPNRNTKERLIKEFARGHLADNLDMDAVCSAIDGCTPAIVNEILERSLIDSQIAGTGIITTEMLLEHTKGMEIQKKMALPEYRKGSVADHLADNLYKITQGIAGDD